MKLVILMVRLVAVDLQISISWENSNPVLHTVHLLFSSKSQLWRNEIGACFDNHRGFTWDHTYFFIFFLSVVYNIRIVSKLQRELWASSCFYQDSVSSWGTGIVGVSKSEEINMALDEAAAWLHSSPSVQEWQQVLQSCVRLRHSQLFSPRALAASTTTSFHLTFGVNGLVIIIIIILERLGLQI